MDKNRYRERMRKKQQQLRRRRYMRLATYAVAFVLLAVFVVRGIIFPIIDRVGGHKPDETVEVQAQVAAADPNAAVRQPLKGQGDVSKASVLTPGWHEDENGRWYQNADHTYYTGGFQEIDGVTYCFDGNGYMQTGWVTKGVKDYYFNDDGSYNPDIRRPMLALTFDDGPGEYTDGILDVLEENNAHATFFMLGQNVGLYPEVVQRMKAIGCELGSHSWDHPMTLVTIGLDSVAKQFADTDAALIEACGQASTVARAPYGEWNQDVIDTVQKPFFMWSLDSLDWKLRDVQADYDMVLNGDLTDGTIILMHDIHQASAESIKRIVPDLVAQGYKLVTVSELAEAKGVTLQNASYSDFWDSSLANGEVAGYNMGSTDSGSDAVSDGEASSEELSDGSWEESGELSDGSEDESVYSDGQ